MPPYTNALRERKMDTLYIKDLKLEANLGCLAWEKAIKQPILINLSFNYNTKAARNSDDITQALDYTQVITAIETCVNQKHYALIEHLANELMIALFKQFTLMESITLQLAKPNIVRHCKEIGIQIHRERTQQL